MSTVCSLHVFLLASIKCVSLCFRPMSKWPMAGQWDRIYPPPLMRPLGRSFSPLLRYEFMVFRSVNLDIIGFFSAKIVNGLYEYRGAVVFCSFHFIPLM